MPSLQLQLESLFNAALDKGASDLYLVAGQRPVVRVRGDLFLISDYEVLTKDDTASLIDFMLSEEQRASLAKNRELDFAFAFRDIARFRVSVYYQRGVLSAALRAIPRSVRSLEQLGLPSAIGSFAQVQRGLVLFAGPTGSGKSTTLASLIDAINHTRPARIITIEDPIEYVFEHDQSIVEQREVGKDTPSIAAALDDVLRQSPDVVMISEVRSATTVERMLAVAETSHVVYATLPTDYVAPSLEWLVHLFPTHRHDEIRARLAVVLAGVVSQHLVETIDGGRVPATEVFINNEAAQGFIRKGAFEQLDDIMTTNLAEGMMTMDRSLAQLVRSERVAREVAMRHAMNLAHFESLVNG